MVTRYVKLLLATQDHAEVKKTLEDGCCALTCECMDVSSERPGQDMRNFGIKPNVVTYNSLIKAISFAKFS